MNVLGVFVVALLCGIGVWRRVGAAVVGPVLAGAAFALVVGAAWAVGLIHPAL